MQRPFEFAAQVLLCYGAHAASEKYVPDRSYTKTERGEIRMVYTEAVANFATCAAAVGGDLRRAHSMYLALQAFKKPTGKAYTACLFLLIAYHFFGSYTSPSFLVCLGVDALFHSLTWLKLFIPTRYLAWAPAAGLGAQAALLLYWLWHRLLDWGTVVYLLLLPWISSRL